MKGASEGAFMATSRTGLPSLSLANNLLFSEWKRTNADVVNSVEKLSKSDLVECALRWDWLSDVQSESIDIQSVTLDKAFGMVEKLLGMVEHNKAYVDAYPELFAKYKSLRTSRANLDTVRAAKMKAAHLERIKPLLSNAITALVKKTPSIKDARVLDSLLSKNPDGTMINAWLVTYMGTPYKRSGLRDLVAPLLAIARKR